MKFQPGRSGNPAGKARGTKHRVTILAERLMEDDAQDVVRNHRGGQRWRHERVQVGAGSYRADTPAQPMERRRDPAMWIGFESFEGAGRYVRKRAQQRLGTELPDNYSGFEECAHCKRRPIAASSAVR
jgi:hypothetical protein